MSEQVASESVKVLNPYGEPETIHPGELGAALKMGYSLPTPEQVKEYQDQQTYGEGIANPLKAFGAGAARGATFGLSDQALTKTGLVAPETLAGLEKYNPVASGLGEVTGVAGMLLAPELGAAGAAGEGAGAAGTAARLANPVKAVSELGKAATEAATPVAERLAGTVANPETAARAHEILSKGIAHGMGSAVEGAAYGLGQSVSEQALGDPDLNAEKVLSNVGMSAVFAGALGGMFGAASGLLPEKAAAVAQRELPGFEKPAQTELGGIADFEQTIKNSEFSQKEKEGILSGLSKRKVNSAEIEDAARFLDAPLLPGQLSDSEMVQRAQDSLLHGPPTASALKVQAIANDGFEKATGAVERAIGDGTAFSKASVGERLQESLVARFEAEHAPIKQIYDELKDYTQAIGVNETSTRRIAGNIRKLAEEHSLIKGTPEYNFIMTMADGLGQVDTLDKLKTFRTAMGRATGKDTRFVASLVKEKLDTLEENVIKRFAQTMKTPDAKAKIMGLLEQSEQAKSSYKALRDKMQEFGDILGKGKIYGPQDFIDFLNEATPEKFADRLFAKNNSRFMQFFSQNFPQEFGIMREYRLNLIRQKAVKDEAFNLREVFKQVNGLEPEIRNVLFTPGQLEAIKKAETYIKSMPKNFNPSGTSNADALRHYFEKGMTGAVLSNARDFAIDQFIKQATKFDPAQGEHVARLIKLERAAQKTTQQITQGAKAIFKTGAAAAVPIAALMPIKGDKAEKKLGEVKEHIDSVTQEPERAIDTLHGATKDLWVSAPKTSEGVQMASLRAAQFLKSKLPQQPQNKLFSPNVTPSPAEIHKFFRYYTAVEKPTSVLDHVKAGTVTPESIETLNTVYPKLYAEMKSAIMGELSERMSKGETIPYKTQLSLSMFMGQDLTPSLTPAAIQMTQSQLAAKGNDQPSQGIRPTQKGLSSLTLDTAMMTPNQNNSQRRDV